LEVIEGPHGRNSAVDDGFLSIFGRDLVLDLAA